MYKNLYGSTLIAAKYCGIEIIKNEPDGIWAHGWAWGGLKYADEIFGTDIENYDTPLFTANKRDALFLNNFGYRNVHAIGLPIVYVPNLETVKIKTKRRLLVMPSHMMPGCVHDIDRENEYVEFISLIKNNFDECIVSLNAYDYYNSFWKESFEKAGVKVICGVDVTQQDGLAKLIDMLSSFSHVTCNGLGSQIVYAGSIGCSVSIAGPIMKYYREELEQMEYYVKFPDRIDNAEKILSESYARENFNWLFKAPQEGVVCKEWAQTEIGYDLKITPRQMMEFFGWKADIWLPVIKKSSDWLNVSMPIMYFIENYKPSSIVILGDPDECVVQACLKVIKNNRYQTEITIISGKQNRETEQSYLNRLADEGEIYLLTVNSKLLNLKQEIQNQTLLINLNNNNALPDSLSLTLEEKLNEIDFMYIWFDKDKNEVACKKFINNIKSLTKTIKIIGKNTFYLKYIIKDSNPNPGNEFNIQSDLFSIIGELFIYINQDSERIKSHCEDLYKIRYDLEKQVKNLQKKFKKYRNNRINNVLVSISKKILEKCTFIKNLKNPQKNN